MRPARPVLCKRMQIQQRPIQHHARPQELWVQALQQAAVPRPALLTKGHPAFFHSESAAGSAWTAAPAG